MSTPFDRLPPKDPALIRTPATVDPTLALQKQIATLDTERQVQAAALKERDQQIAALNTEVLQLKQQAPLVQQLEAQRNTLQMQVTSLSQESQKASTEVKTLQTQIAAQQAQINQLGKLASDNALLQKQIDALKAGKAAQVSLGNLISDTSSQLEQVQQRLKEEGRSFRLGKISMDLKVLPTGAGTDLTFLRPEEMGTVSAEQLSAIKVDFNPTSVPAAAEARQVAVPQLIGYTQVMARRKLADGGFVVDITYEAVKPEPGKPNPAGRVVSQWPKPNELVAPGSRVSIAIGKPTVSVAP
jgi:hypothetical protein